MSSSLYVVKSNLIPRVKICSDCKYYSSVTQKCAKFVYINIITAERVLLDAKIMRSETSFCGFGAVHYEYNPKKYNNKKNNNQNESIDPLDLSNIDNECCNVID